MTSHIYGRSTIAIL